MPSIMSFSWSALLFPKFQMEYPTNVKRQPIFTQPLPEEAIIGDTLTANIGQLVV